MLMEQIFVKWTCPRRVPSTVPGAPESSCFVCYAVFLGAQGRAFRVVTMYSAPQAINASGGFARCKDASQHGTKLHGMLRLSTRGVRV